MNCYFTKYCICCASEYYKKPITEEQLVDLEPNSNLEVTYIGEPMIAKAELRSLCPDCSKPMKIPMSEESPEVFSSGGGGDFGGGASGSWDSPDSSPSCSSD